MVVYVEPQLDRVGTGEAHTAPTLSHTEGEWAGPLEMPDKSDKHTTQNNSGKVNSRGGRRMRSIHRAAQYVPAKGGIMKLGIISIGLVMLGMTGLVGYASGADTPYGGQVLDATLLAQTGAGTGGTGSGSAGGMGSGNAGSGMPSGSTDAGKTTGGTYPEKASPGMGGDPGMRGTPGSSTGTSGSSSGTPGSSTGPTSGSGASGMSGSGSGSSSGPGGGGK